MGPGIYNAAYGVSARPQFTGEPGATNSMIPLNKFNDAPDLPPWKDPYSMATPRNVMATPNPYTLNHSQSDTYTVMNPAGSVFAPGVPPPQYEACSKKLDDHEVYSEIPGEYSTFQSSNPDSQPQPQYGNVPSIEKKDLSKQD